MHWAGSAGCHVVCPHRGHWVACPSTWVVLSVSSVLEKSLQIHLSALQLPLSATSPSLLGTQQLPCSSHTHGGLGILLDLDGQDIANSHSFSSSEFLTFSPFSGFTQEARCKFPLSETCEGFFPFPKRRVHDPFSGTYHCLPLSHSCLPVSVPPSLRNPFLELKAEKTCFQRQTAFTTEQVLFFLIAVNIYHIKLTILTILHCHFSLALSTFLLLCNYRYLAISRIVLSSWTKVLSPLNTNSPFLPSPSPWQPPFHFCHYECHHSRHLIQGKWYNICPFVTGPFT